MAKKNEIVVLDAHYDRYDLIPATEDNASGVAGLLAIARTFQKETKSNFSLKIVAYNTKKPPCFILHLWEVKYSKTSK